MNSNKKIMEFPEAKNMDNHSDYLIFSKNGKGTYRINRDNLIQKDYTDLNNLPTLNTEYTYSLTAGVETISGEIKLHLVSKSGNYSDLLNLPFIPANLTDLENDDFFVQDENYVHTDNNFTNNLLNLTLNSIQGVRRNSALLIPDEDNIVNVAIPTQVSDLNDGVQVLTNINGTHALQLTSALLTRVINGTTAISKSLFDSNEVFVPNRTLIHDDDGTVGKYINDIDSATLNVQTVTISSKSTDEPTLLGNVATNANLPLTISDAESPPLNWQTPQIDDYAVVENDETMSNQTVEWYIIAIDESGNITWGNPRVLNTSDYQQQTTAADAGKVLIGGAMPGTFGTSRGIDNMPTHGSDNLITSDAVYSAIKSGEGLPVGAKLDHSSLNIPEGFLARDGQAISRTIYADLFAEIGTTYGAGDGSTTFNVPDDRGRMDIGYDSTDSNFNLLSIRAGNKTVTLAVANLAAHNHSWSGTALAGHTHTEPAVNTGGISANHTHTGTGFYNIGSEGNGYFRIAPWSGTQGSATTGTISSDHVHAKPATTSSSVSGGTPSGTIGNAGSGTAFSILGPYSVSRKIIKY